MNAKIRKNSDFLQIVSLGLDFYLASFKFHHRQVQLASAFYDLNIAYVLWDTALTYGVETA